MATKLGVQVNVTLKGPHPRDEHREIMRGVYRCVFDHSPSKVEIMSHLMGMAADPSTSERGRQRLVETATWLATLDEIPTINTNAGDVIEPVRVSSYKGSVVLSVVPIAFGVDNSKPEPKRYMDTHDVIAHYKGQEIQVGALKYTITEVKSIDSNRSHGIDNIEMTVFATLELPDGKQSPKLFELTIPCVTPMPYRP